MKHLIAFALAILVCATAQAQIAEVDQETGPLKYGEPQVSRFQAGAEVTASRGACRNIRVMVAVPLECPEQEVTVVEEDFSREVGKVNYRLLDGGARQMLITIPRLNAGATARAVVTFEVRGRAILPPEEEATVLLELPERPSRDIRRYLAASPYIEARDKRIRSLAGELWHQAVEVDGQVASEPTAWQRIETLYDYVQDNVKYIEEVEDKSAVNTLRDGNADCHGRAALFVALCRASDVPARIVWVNNHCFSEFYLEDSDGAGYWFPAESAGTRAFGEMPLTRTVLQKGDNFRVPERPRDRLRYASDYLIGVPVPGSGQPKARFIREHIEL